MNSTMTEMPEFTTAKISKGNRGHRLIYIPNKSLKDKLRSHLPYLLYKNLLLEEYGTCQAFIRGRNCATNAIRHLGNEYSLSFDIKEFFDSVRPHHVENKLDHQVIDDCFINGAPRQGLPTSPLIANIALIDADNQIIRSLRDLMLEFSYTRYADDITISFDDKKAIPKISYIVRSVISAYGFKLNNASSEKFVGSFRHR